MAVLDATVSGPDANSYLTEDEADELLEGFPGKVMDRWDDLEQDARCALLLEGTRKIDQYLNWGPRKVSDQRLSFPRATDPVDKIPEEVRHAVVEFIAYQLDAAMVPLKRLQEEGVTSASILGQSSSFEADKSGLPAGARRELDKLSRSHWTVPTGERDLHGNTDPLSFFG